MRWLYWVALLLMLASCKSDYAEPLPVGEELAMGQCHHYNPTKNPYFGDLHVHTDYSFDAYAFGTVATPYDAYRYAQGEALQHASGISVPTNPAITMLITIASAIIQAI